MKFFTSEDSTRDNLLLEQERDIIILSRYFGHYVFHLFENKARKFDMMYVHCHRCPRISGGDVACPITKTLAANTQETVSPKYNDYISLMI